MLSSMISVSMMCADILWLANDLKKLEDSKVDYLHFDIMDNCFVDNIMFSPYFVNIIKNATNIPSDIHLMVEKPESLLSKFELSSDDYLSIHIESSPHIQKILTKIKDTGAKSAVSLNPSTPIWSIEEILPDIDMLLIMTVNPGYAGQKLVSQSINKIAKARKFLDERGYANIRIEVDGNVSFENAKRMREVGADTFVAGSSSVFTSGIDIREGMSKLRVSIE